MKHKPEEQYNPFDDIFFWLQLAGMDFTFGFEENMNTKTDASISKDQPPEEGQKS